MNILLVRVLPHLGYKGGLSKLTALVGVRLDIPVSVHIARLVLLDTSGFNLLETPLRQVDITSPEVTTHGWVAQSECSGQSADLGTITGCRIVNDFDLPVILVIANSDVAVARNLVVGLGNRGSDSVGVQVTTGLSVNETDGVSIGNELEIAFGFILGLVTAGVNEPVVVGILVVVAGNLLLVRTLRIGLKVGVQETTAITHVLDGDSGSVSNLKRAISAHLGTTQVRLEKRAHLRIAGATVGQDGEMQVEREHVNQKRDDNQASHTSEEMLGKQGLRV